MASDASEAETVAKLRRLLSLLDEDTFSRSEPPQSRVRHKSIKEEEKEDKVLTKRRRISADAADFARRVSGLSDGDEASTAGAYEAFVDTDAKVLPYYELTCSLHLSAAFRSFLERRLVVLLDALLPFRPQWLLDVTATYPFARDFIVSFLGLRLSHVPTEDLVDIEPLLRREVLYRHWLLRSLLKEDSVVSLFPPDSRAVTLTVDLWFAPHHKVPLTSLVGRRPVTHLSPAEAFAWGRVLVADASAQRLPSDKMTVRLLKQLRTSSLRTIGSTLADADVAQIALDGTLSRILREVRLEHEDIRADFVFRLLLHRLDEALRADDASTWGDKFRTDLPWLTQLIETVVHWSGVREVVRDAFHRRLAFLIDLFVSSASIDSAQSLVEALQTLLDAALTVAAHGAKRRLPAGLPRFPQDTTWDIQGHPLAHCLDITRPPEHASAVDIAIKRPRDVPIQVRATAAVLPGQCRVFDVEYLWRKTRCCVGSHPLVGVVTEKGLLPGTCAVLDTPEALGWAVDIEISSVSLVHSFPQKQQSNDALQGRNAALVTTGTYRGATLTTPLRIVIDRTTVPGRFLLLSTASMEFYEEILSQIEPGDVPGPLYPAIAIASGAFRGFFSSAHPALQSTDEFVKAYLLATTAPAPRPPVGVAHLSPPPPLATRLPRWFGSGKAKAEAKVMQQVIDRFKLPEDRWVGSLYMPSKRLPRRRDVDRSPVPLVRRLASPIAAAGSGFLTVSRKTLGVLPTRRLNTVTRRTSASQLIPSFRAHRMLMLTDSGSFK